MSRLLSVILLFFFLWLSKRTIHSKGKRKKRSIFHPKQTPEAIGRKGEKKVGAKIEGSIPGLKARKLNNLVLAFPNGTTTEIDEVLVAESGIYVIEVKNYKGWIFGNMKDTYWTQSLKGSRGTSERHSFYNPIFQNQTHIRVLKKTIPTYIGPYHSIIVFSDEAEFKNLSWDSLYVDIVHSSKLQGLLRRINASSTFRMSAAERDSLYALLLEASSGTSRKVHVQTLQEKKEKSGFTTYCCPLCGERLVLRTAKKGPNAGKDFLGCSSFPRCRFTKEI